MTLRTTPGSQVKITWCTRRSGMLRFNMTLLAKPRPLGFEQLVVLGTMRLVAVQAVFPHRGMLPKEGPFFLGVAGETVFVHRGLL